VSSLLRLSLIIFGPVMLGFGLALVVTKGVFLVVALPLVAAFVLMVTALTYQLQGWLASLMSNPRRRRTVIMLTTVIFVLIVQLPNLLNILAPWEAQRRIDRSRNAMEELAQLERAAKAGGLSTYERARRHQELMQKQQRAREQANRESAARWEQTARLVNMVLPVGWLPLGVMAAAERNIAPAILGLLGMTLIGTFSLRRAYRTTIGLYQERFTSGEGRPAPVITRQARTPTPRSSLIEARLPGLSEPVSAIALGGFQSLLRAPEAKMMLLTPLLLTFAFGSMLWRGRHSIPEWVRPLLGMGGLLVVLFGVMQLMANQFGFDRDGFRVFVLSAAPRRDILMGKNLAFAPLALGLALFLLVILQAVCPMRPDHVLAMLPEYVSTFLLFCILTNLLSIYAPVYVAPGSLKPSNPKLAAVLFQLVIIMFFLPLTQALALLPWGTEAVLRLFGWTSGIPVFLLLSLAECAVVVVIYRFALDGLGSLLQAREQKILDCVTSRAL
jgi:hypothetical protein